MTKTIKIETQFPMDYYCCICLDNFATQFSSIKTLDCCNQSIHKSCLLQLINFTTDREFQCPLCRKHSSFYIFLKTFPLHILYYFIVKYFVIFIKILLIILFW
jgi:hypothetical protein